jgi:hypothetical protein
MTKPLAAAVAFNFVDTTMAGPDAKTSEEINPLT